MNFIKISILNDYLIENNINLSLIIDEFGYNQEYLFLSNVSIYYKYYLILTIFQDKLIEHYKNISKESIYYDRYYWFTLFIKKLDLIGHCGEDMKQYRYILLENLTNDIKNIDWDLLMKIDEIYK